MNNADVREERDTVCVSVRLSALQAARLEEFGIISVHLAVTIYESRSDYN